MTRDLAINKFLAENNISSRDRLFECVFNHSSVGQAIALSSGKMCLNRAFCDWLGFPEEEIRDKSWKDLVCPEDVEPFQKTVERLFSGEIDSDISIRRFIRKDGTILWGKAHVSHCRNVPESGDILVTTVADITSDVNK